MLIRWADHAILLLQENLYITEKSRKLLAEVLAKYISGSILHVEKQKRMMVKKAITESGKFLSVKQK
jgi:hypothetical protein